MASETSPFDPPDQDKDLLKRLFIACEDNNFAEVLHILNYNLKLVNSRNVFGRKATPLHYAAAFGPFFVIKYLIENRADVNTKDLGGLTPLHDACSYGRSDVVSILLKHGSYVNARDRWNYTPLHQAAINGKVLVCLVLLQNGADPNITTVDGKTPINVAHPKAKPVLTGEYKKEELFQAIRCGNHEQVMALMTPLNINCHTSDSNMVTPLHLAAEYNRTAILFFLLKNGADVNARDKVGLKALDIACSLGNTECVEMLMKQYYPSDQQTNVYQHSSNLIERKNIFPEIQVKYEEVLSQSDSSNTTVYYRAVSLISDEMIYSIFTRFGTIKEVRNFAHYAFIRFMSKEAAALAIYTLNNNNLNKQTKCSWAKEPNAVIKELGYNCENASSSAATTNENAEGHHFIAQGIKDFCPSLKRRYTRTDVPAKKQKLDSDFIHNTPSSVMKNPPYSLSDKSFYLVMEIRAIILMINDPNGLDLDTIKKNLILTGKIEPDETEENVRNVVYFGIGIKLIRRIFP